MKPETSNPDTGRIFDQLARSRRSTRGFLPDPVDAPQVVFILMPAWCGIHEACDVGMYAQSLMLAMRAHGIVSCPQTILGYDADTVRRELNIDSEMKLLFGVSFGYEDSGLPENQIVPERAALGELVLFHS